MAPACPIRLSQAKSPRNCNHPPTARCPKELLQGPNSRVLSPESSHPAPHVSPGHQSVPVVQVRVMTVDDRSVSNWRVGGMLPWPTRGQSVTDGRHTFLSCEMTSIYPNPSVVLVTICPFMPQLCKGSWTLLR